MNGAALARPLSEGPVSAHRDGSPGLTNPAGRGILAEPQGSYKSLPEKKLKKESGSQR